MAIVDEGYVKEIEKARRELRYLITNKQCAPLMRRLAWRDATTTGGANGSIRLSPTKTELEPAIKLCEEVKAKLKKVSYADLYQLAGIVAIEVTGGPTIPFLPGRQDPIEYPPEGRLLRLQEDLDAQGLRDTFSRMGISEDKDIVALCGGIRALLLSNESPGQSAKDPLKFDNSYFTKLSNIYPRPPIEGTLLKDKEFSRFVKLYAEDEDAFFKDYAIAHEKLSELGCNLEKLNQPKPPKVLFEKLNQPRKLIGIGLVSVVVTVILGYLTKKKKRNHLEDEEDF